MLNEIEKKTRQFMEEMKWSDQEISDLVAQANRAFSCRSEMSDASNIDLEHSLVIHRATYSGGFILFGGWTRIFDQTIPEGVRGHQLYLAFGGIGVGGWSGDCNIELATEGYCHDGGVSYLAPAYHYGGNDKKGCETGFDWFHNNVKSFMFMYLPIFEQPIPVFVYFDGGGRRIGVSVPNCSFSCGMGGGSVEVWS